MEYKDDGNPFNREIITLARQGKSYTNRKTKS